MFNLCSQESYVIFISVSFSTPVLNHTVSFYYMVWDWVTHPKYILTFPCFGLWACCVCWLLIPVFGNTVNTPFIFSLSIYNLVLLYNFLLSPVSCRNPIYQEIPCIQIFFKWTVNRFSHHCWPFVLWED